MTAITATTIRNCNIHLEPSSDIPKVYKCQGRRIYGAVYFQIPDTSLKAIALYTRSYGKKSYTFDFGKTWSTNKSLAFDYFLQNLSEEIKDPLCSVTHGTLYVKEV